MDEDAALPQYSAISPGVIPLHPPSDPSLVSPTKIEHSDEAYERALAEHRIYTLTRSFAIATKLLAAYDCQECLYVLEELVPNQQRSAWVMAMVGRAHYELGQYGSVSTP